MGCSEEQNIENTPELEEPEYIGLEDKEEKKETLPETVRRPVWREEVEGIKNLSQEIALLKEILKNNQEQLEKMNKKLDLFAQEKYNARQSQLILKEKLDQADRIIQFNKIRSFMKELIYILDKVEDFKKRSGNENDQKMFQAIALELRQMLLIRDVLPLDTKKGEKFNPKIHSAHSSVQTNQKEDDGNIAEIIFPGYYFLEGEIEENSIKIVRPTVVKVYHFVG